jgi:chromosome segregation ATPase
VTSADFTDSPAANPTGLFTQIDKQPKTKMTKSELETLSQELEASKVELETSVETLSSENSELEVSLSSAKQECSELTEKLDAKSAEVTELSAKVDSLKGQLQASDGALAEKTELAEASASKVEELEDELAKRNGRIIELEALVSGSNPVPGNQGGEDQKPTAAERNSIVAEFAKENKISEAQAVIQLSRIRPELWA